MTSREDLIETGYAAYMAHRPVFSMETCEVDSCTCGERLNPEGWHRHSVTAAVDAVLPQITAAEQLEALPPCMLRSEPDGYAWPQVLTWSAGELRYGNHGEPADARAVLRAGPLTVVWQP